MKSGYVKLWRKSLRSRIFVNPNLWKVWSWCLMKANHEGAWVSVNTGKGFKEIYIEPGQFIFGRNTAAKELHMKPSTVRNYISKLKRLKNLDTQPDTHYTIITIINWTIYQGEKHKVDRLQDNQRTTKGQPEDTNKNDNNDKKKKLYDFFVSEISPKRKSRQRALKNIGKHLKRFYYDDLKESILNYKSTLNGTDPTYRKDPANFFGVNESYFLDFLSENFQSNDSKQISNVSKKQQTMEELFSND